MAGPCDSFYYQNPGSGQTFLCHEPRSGGACVSTNVFYCPPPSPPPLLPPSSPLDYAVFLERLQSLPSLFMHFADAPFWRSSWAVLLAETGLFGLLLFCACLVGCRAGASLAGPRERRHDRLVETSLVEGTEGWWADEDPQTPDPSPPPPGRPDGQGASRAAGRAGRPLPPPGGPRVRQVWLTKTASGVGLNISEDGEVLLVTSPAAEAAGVLVGDRVVAVNGCAADTLPAIAQVLRSAAVGQPAALSLLAAVGSGPWSGCAVPAEGEGLPIGADHRPTPVEPLLTAPPDSAAESAPPPTTTDPPRADEESTEMFLRLAKAASNRHGMRVRSRSTNMYFSHAERAEEVAATRDRFALGGEKLPLAAGLEGAAKGASSPPRRQVDVRFGAEEETGRAAAKKGEAAASAAEAAVDAVAARVAAQAALAEAAMAEAAADTEAARVAAQAALAAAGAAKACGGVAITVARRTPRRSIAEVIERRLTGNASPLQLHSPISTPPGSRPTSPPPVQVGEIRAEVVRSVRGLRSSAEPEVSPPAAAEPEGPERLSSAQRQGAEVEQQTQGAVAEVARVARPEAKVQRLQEVVEAEARARTDTREGRRGSVDAEGVACSEADTTEEAETTEEAG